MRYPPWLAKTNLGFLPKNVRPIVLNVVSLAHFALIHSRAWAADSPLQRVRLAAQLDQARTKNAQLEAIARVKDARMARTPPHHRANYLPHERQFILETMAANGWAIAHTARVFMLDPDTIASWLAIIIDHFSRKVIGFAVFTDQPSSLQVRSFIGRAIHQSGQAPKYIVSDKGTQFWHAAPKRHCKGGCLSFKDWCKRNNIRPRYGAVGQYGSIAIIERLIRSLKSECTRRIIVPMRQAEMRHELGLYFTWYNECRPHQGIKGKTPLELYSGISQAPPKLDLLDPNLNLILNVAYMRQRPHLPIVSLKRAA